MVLVVQNTTQTVVTDGVLVAENAIRRAIQGGGIFRLPFLLLK